MGFSYSFFLQFQSIMENLFQTFDSMVSAANFGELSSTVFGWVEENCKPQVYFEFFKYYYLF